MTDEEHNEVPIEEPAQEAQTIEEPQPKSNLELEQTNQLIRDHMELLKAQKQQAPRQHEPETQDDDIMTVGMAKKALREMNRANEELRVAAKNKDYEEVITKYLPEAIKENPSIRTWIENSESPYEQAYYLAKKSDAYLKERAVKSRSQDAEKIAKNNRTAGNLSAIGTNSSARGTTDYKSMSDEDFRQVMARNMGY